jgi:hypothetical protein
MQDHFISTKEFALDAFPYWTIFVLFVLLTSSLRMVPSGLIIFNFVADIHKQGGLVFDVSAVNVDLAT